MKIIGMTYIDSKKAMYLKPDSALLVGGKPFFLPHFSEQIAVHPCVVVRISRLGRYIEERFAARYYDGITTGMNLQAADLLTPPCPLDMWTRATGFDNSLVVGDWLPADVQTDWKIGAEGEEHTYRTEDLTDSIEKSISEISKYITIRMGDMIAIDFESDKRLLKKEEIWRGTADGRDVMYCKIK